MRLLFRMLASLALAVAVIFAVLDATRSLAASRAVWTPLGESWAASSAGTLRMAEEFVSGLSPAFWTLLGDTLLVLPGFAVFAALSFLFFAIGHRRDTERLARHS